MICFWEWKAKIAIYGDYATLYYGKHTQEILKIFFQGFCINRHVANADKFHLQTGFRASKTFDLSAEMKETYS